MADTQKPDLYQVRLDYLNRTSAPMQSQMQRAFEHACRLREIRHTPFPRTTVSPLIAARDNK